MNDQLQICCVHEAGRLRDAMWALDRGAMEIALVTDARNRLLGTMTDGDVRRALLRGATLDCPLAPYYQRHFTAVDPGTHRTDVVELMQARHIAQIPIVDGEGRLVGLHMLRNLIGRQPRPNWAVVMAGGQGTRLRPFTEHMPKPMVRVAGRPILERLVLHLVGSGIRRIYLSISYLGHLIENHFGGGERFGCEIRYLRETHPLGTGGALSLLPESPQHPLLVLNGDLLTQADLGAMLEFHEHNLCMATVAVKRYSHRVPFGCLELQGTRVVGIEEKPILTRVVNAGIYVLGPELVASIPRDQELPMTTLLEQALVDSCTVGAFEICDDWLDVGTPEQLRVAREGSA